MILHHIQIVKVQLIYGDGYCDAYNNNPECGWDAGDCCAETCTVPCDDPQNTILILVMIVKQIRLIMMEME